MKGILNLQLILSSLNSRPRHYKDGRTWRQRLTRLHSNWIPFLDAVTSAFLHWKYPNTVDADNVTCSLPSSAFDSSIDVDMEPTPSILMFEIETIDLYELERVVTITRSQEMTVAESLVRNGWLGTSPINPSIAVSLKTLELFRRLRLRKASLSVEAFAKVLCDLYSVRQMSCFLLILCDFRSDSISTALPKCVS